MAADAAGVLPTRGQHPPDAAPLPATGAAARPPALLDPQQLHQGNWAKVSGAHLLFLHYVSVYNI